MYNLDQLVEKLNAEQIFTDVKTLSAYIKENKIEPVYENSHGVDYYDDSAYEKLHGLVNFDPPKPKKKESFDDLASLHAQTARELEKLILEGVIAEHANEIPAYSPFGNPEPQPEPQLEQFSTSAEILMEEEATPVMLPEIPQEQTAPSIRLDVTEQTLNTISQALADKITTSVTEFLNAGDLAHIAVQLGKVKKENELLAVKYKKLAAKNAANEKLLKEKQEEISKFKPTFFGFYKKDKK